MTRYVAFLRGVSPVNLKMAELAACLEAAGFHEPKTVLASGNVVFGHRKATDAALERKLEALFEAELGRPFGTFVRSVDHLRALLAKDPYAAFDLPAKAKRVVSFLKTKPSHLALPITLEGATIFGLSHLDAFSAYVVKPGDPVFMRLIEKTFGKEVTTRTWDTLTKCAT